MREPCRFSETVANLSGLVDIEPAPIVGGSATVHRGTLRTTGIKVAVKTGRFLNDPQSDERVLREIHIVASLGHENIIELLGYFVQDSTKIMMVTPWMDMGDAFTYVKDTGVDPRPLLRGIADGICYLHNQDIFHGDLKGKNVLISEDHRPKIIDFGNASSPSFDAVHNLSGGSTLKWMAPEAIEEGGLATAKGDVWAFGMTALELLTRNSPFHDIPIQFILIRIYQGPPERPSGQSTHFRMTEEWWTICLACWNLDAGARPQMSAILNRIG